MQNHHRPPSKLLLFLGAMSFFCFVGCASVTQQAPRDVTPEATNGASETDLSEGNRKAAPRTLDAGFEPVLANSERLLVEGVARLAQGHEVSFFYGGAFAIVFGAILIGGALALGPGEHTVQTRARRREEVVGAALRMLSSPELQVRSAQRYPTSEGDLTAAEAELVRSTVRRLSAQSAPRRRSTAAPIPLVRLRSRHGSPPSADPLRAPMADPRAQAEG